MLTRLLFSILVFCSLVTGCGFQLRGATNLPFKTLFIGVRDTSPIAVELKRNIRGNGPTQIVTSASQAEAIFEILGESRRSDLLTINVAGAAVQYKLLYTVRFRVHDPKGREFLAPTELTLTRSFINNNNAVLVQESEINQLFTDMQSDAVQQILRRMEAITPEKVRAVEQGLVPVAPIIVVPVDTPEQ